MTTKPAAREARSVRLNTPEWVTAEAIARMDGERSSAGLGLRTALRIAVNQIRRQGRGLALEAHMDQIMRERAEALAADK